MCEKSDDHLTANQYFEELRASGVRVVVPKVSGIDWSRIMADPSIPLIITNKPSQAEHLCRLGQPSIAIMGASDATVVEWLRSRGADVKGKGALQ
jgi:hypothetical protein